LFVCFIFFPLKKVSGRSNLLFFFALPFFSFVFFPIAYDILKIEGKRQNHLAPGPKFLALKQL
jgi:hypothetical protein